MESIKPDEFFKLIAINSGVSDLSIVKNFYYGLIRTISRELRNKHTIRLPDWGEFVLGIYKARNIKSVDGSMISIPAKPTVRFKPDRKVKKYFLTLGNE